MRKFDLNAKLRGLRHNRRKAVTILEFLIWTGLVAVVLGGVGLYSLTARNSSKVNSTITEIGQIRSSIDALYPTNNYANLVTSQLLSVVPTSLIGGTAPDQTVNNPFGGTVEAAVATAGNDSYTVLLTDLPISACQSLAAVDFGAGATALSINGTAEATVPVVASADCNVAANTVEYTFH